MDIVEFNPALNRNPHQFVEAPDVWDGDFFPVSPQLSFVQAVSKIPERGLSHFGSFGSYPSGTRVVQDQSPRAPYSWLFSATLDTNNRDRLATLIMGIHRAFQPNFWTFVPSALNANVLHGGKMAPVLFAVVRGLLDLVARAMQNHPRQNPDFLAWLADVWLVIEWVVDSYVWVAASDENQS